MKDIDPRPEQRRDPAEAQTSRRARIEAGEPSRHPRADPEHQEDPDTDPHIDVATKTGQETASDLGADPNISANIPAKKNRKKDPEFEPEDDTDPDTDPDTDANPVLESPLEPHAVDSDEEAPQPLRHSGVVTDMASAGWSAAGPMPLGSRPAGLAHSSTPAAYIPDTGEPTDAAIMLRVRAGDEAAFTYLIEKYQRQIVHFMFRMVHNQAVAEELAQEVFLRVYRSRESYRAEAKFSTWLYRIATNLGVNHARDNKHERAAQNVYLDQPDAETGTTPDVADSRSTIEQTMLRDERMRAIRQHVMALPERQRSAVLMHKYQEMDYKQIGEVLKLSESATKSLLFRAYQTLRERLKEYV